MTEKQKQTLRRTGPTPRTLLILKAIRKGDASYGVLAKRFKVNRSYLGLVKMRYGKAH